MQLYYNKKKIQEETTSGYDKSDCLRYITGFLISSNTYDEYIKEQNSFNMTEDSGDQNQVEIQETEDSISKKRKKQKKLEKKDKKDPKDKNKFGIQITYRIFVTDIKKALAFYGKAGWLPVKTKIEGIEENDSIEQSSLCKYVYKVVKNGVVGISVPYHKSKTATKKVACEKPFYKPPKPENADSSYVEPKPKFLAKIIRERDTIYVSQNFKEVKPKRIEPGL